MPSAIHGNAVAGMDALLMCELLRQASVHNNGKLQLNDETVAGRAVAELGFLVDQRWLAEDGVGTWTVTPAGQFWFQCLCYGDIVKFHEYSGAVFLLHARSIRNETIVWHKARFATISIEFIPQPEHFEVRKENELTTKHGGVQMQDALVVACCLLAENMEVPQPPQPRELGQHMSKYIERL